MQLEMFQTLTLRLVVNSSAVIIENRIIMTSAFFVSSINVRE